MRPCVEVLYGALLTPQSFLVAARKAKLASFPKKAVQDISEVQRACISLVDSKAALERSRSEAKRSWSLKLQEARTQLNKAKDAVADSSEEVRKVGRGVFYTRIGSS